MFLFSTENSDVLTLPRSEVVPSTCMRKPVLQIQIADNKYVDVHTLQCELQVPEFLDT